MKETFHSDFRKEMFNGNHREHFIEFTWTKKHPIPNSISFIHFFPGANYITDMKRILKKRNILWNSTWVQPTYFNGSVLPRNYKEMRRKCYRITYIDRNLKKQNNTVIFKKAENKKCFFRIFCKSNSYLLVHLNFFHFRKISEVTLRPIFQYFNMLNVCMSKKVIF